ncbi:MULTISPECIES: hypothetical protein [Streptococcus]|jgi:hypothetical protein|uniref:hypothetical protein n=1 Tax=Streptococcus TaxID=1301 RepID=UPI00066D9980|nr:MULTISPECIES: hypothetical protein [Streptococcus]
MGESYSDYKSWYNQPPEIINSKNMLDYLNNNFKIIKFYQDLYKDRISVKDLKNKWNSGEFDNLEIVDLSRFRIFLDAVLLTFNNEKVYKKYFSDKFAFQPFFDRLNDENLDIREREFLKNYKIYLKRMFKIPINKFDSFFIPLNGEKKRVWDQFKIVRNAFSHMQYGFYASDSSGFLSNFSIYNSDKGKTKEIGFVLEPVLHLFIQQFFSNYSFSGVPYKHTWFELNRENGLINFNQVTLSDKVNTKFSGFQKDHFMNQFTSILQSGDKTTIDNFLNNNSFNRKIISISHDEIEQKCLFYLQEKNHKLYDPIHFCESIKFLFDFETEFSNFLVHLIQLNDRLIDYLRDRKLEINRINEIFKSIDELTEDENKFLCFRYSFDLLRMFNISSRLEDDDLPKIQIPEISIKGIYIQNPLALYSYYNNNKIRLQLHSHYDLRSNYIMERIRNAMMHGNYWIDLKESKLFYFFEDKFNKRNEIIEVSQSVLESFVKQKIFQDR